MGGLLMAQKRLGLGRHPIGGRNPALGVLKERLDRVVQYVDRPGPALGTLGPYSHTAVLDVWLYGGGAGGGPAGAGGGGGAAYKRFRLLRGQIATFAVADRAPAGGNGLDSVMTTTGGVMLRASGGLAATSGALGGTGYGGDLNRAGGLGTTGAAGENGGSGGGANGGGGGAGFSDIGDFPKGNGGASHNGGSPPGGGSGYDSLNSLGSAGRLIAMVSKAI